MRLSLNLASLLRAVARRPRTQRFAPDSSLLRNARFDHAHRRFAEPSRNDPVILSCPVFVEL